MTETPREKEPKLGVVSVAARNNPRYAPLGVAYLRERFALTGDGLMWRSGRRAGKHAGSVWRDGYVWVGIMVGGVHRRIRRGRIVFALAYRRWPKCELDHINRDRSDDRPGNLREATRTQNNQNRRAYRKASNLPRGVCRRDGRFEAALGVGGARTYLGRFPSAELASQAYESARASAYGAFA